MTSITQLQVKDYTVTRWAGGQTSEIYLEPPTGAYEIGAFDFRISSATVEVERATFTQLPGYKRLLLPLTSTLILCQNNEEKRISPFEVFAFSGDVETTSFGTGKDLNLIYKETLTGEMRLLDSQDDTLSVTHTSLFFAVTDCCLYIEGDEYVLNPNESLLVSEISASLLVKVQKDLSQPSVILVSCA